MKEADTTPAKYVFLDVVGFTNRRSVEAQADIVGILNSIVRSCLTQHGIPDNKRILLPTGDGICIALLNIENPYDIHIQLALSILEILDGHNTTSDVDDMRRFEVRIGISANTDNLVTDINGKQNLAGAGINEAQRVMGNADGGQILINQTVYSTLRHREKYMGCFDQYSKTIKHGERLTMYQLKMEDSPGLNRSSPEVSVISSKPLPCPTTPRSSPPLYYFPLSLPPVLFELPHIQVAPACNPLLRLLNSQGRHQPQARLAVREDPDHPTAALYLLV